MFHFGRCGSTVLAEGIQQLPGVCWNGEIFTKNTFVYKGFEGTQWDKQRNSNYFSLNEFIDFIKNAKFGFMSNHQNDSKFYGCEIKAHHFEYDFFNFSIEECISSLKTEFKGCKIIFLYRNNSFKRILSSLKARETGVYHTRERLKVKEKFNVSLDDFSDFDLKFSGEIKETLANSAKLEAHYRSLILGAGGLSICYEEEIEYDLSVAISKIANSLKLTPINPQITLKKTSSSSLQESIENFPLLKKRLLGSEFETFLVN